MILAELVLYSILILSIIILVTMVVSLWLLVPYVPTPKKVVEFMIERANLKGSETIYDLGCGDARILIATKKKFPGVRAIGYELPVGVWLLAKIRIWASKQNVIVHLQNYLKADLSDADVIFLYLVPEVMQKLCRKLEKELKPGTRVISHGFKFPDKEPLKVERCPLPTWHIMRPPKKKGPRVYVYEW